MPTPPAEPLPYAAPPFLDVQALLELSRPRRGVNWTGYVFLALFGSVLLTSLTGGHNGGPGKVAGTVAAGIAGVTLVVAVFIAFGIAVARNHRQAQTVQSIEELVLRRLWEPAGLLLNKFLSAPVRSPRVWAKALVQLGAVLGRHHRFADVVTVDDFLLDYDGLLDDATAYGVRAQRAMALLRDDDLLDADRAMSDLRRRGPRASGPLALIEIYRDVKTGHPAEAIEIFEARRDVLRQHLGHRVADAHALVARAYDLLGRHAEAAAAYSRATVLAPAAELHRRYPELAPLLDRYSPTVAPKEVA